MLEKICSIFAPSGRELEMREYIKARISGMFDSIETDNAGNLIAHKNGTASKLCIECGMDICGVMAISKADDKVYFSGVSGVNATQLVDKKVVFQNGEYGVARYDGKNLAEAKVTDVYIEMDSQKIEIGDFGVVEADYFESKSRYFANGLAAKAAIEAVIRAIEESKTDKAFTVVFSAQRRFAAKGIKTFFGTCDFERVVTVDGISCESGIKSGNGCVIVAVDSRGVSDKGFREEIEKISRKKNIKSQTATTDENLCIEAISTSGNSTNCVALGIPVLHKGKAYETVLKVDFDETVKLIKAVIEEL